MLDIETDLSHQIIWLVITKDIDSGEKIIWKAADNLSEYLKDDTQIIGQNIIVRCSNIEPYLEDSDTDESMLRYTISKQTLRSKQRERTQLKRLGTDVGTTED